MPALSRSNRTLSPHVFFLPVTLSMLASVAGLTFLSFHAPRTNPAMPTPTPAFRPTTPKGNFDVALKLLLSPEIEGGFSDDKRDRGGATNLGMSIREVRRMDADRRLDPFLRARFDVNKDGAIDEADVPGWTSDLAVDFYREFYWNAIRGAELPAAVAITLFDSAVNEGVPKAAMHLQRSLGNVTVDGKVGTKTIAAVWAWSTIPGDLKPEEVIFLSRVSRYQSLVDSDRFFRGWVKRAFRVLKASQA